MLKLKIFLKTEIMERLLNLANQGYYGECIELIWEISFSLGNSAGELIAGRMNDSLLSEISRNWGLENIEINRNG